ncbi:MAG: hypothetical protein ACOYM2_16565 [Rectinemataceae bacterium]
MRDFETEREKRARRAGEEAMITAFAEGLGPGRVGVTRDATGLICELAFEPATDADAP